MNVMSVWKKKNTRREFGFSLIELLIVIAIILIIVTVAVPKLSKARMFASETAALAAVKTLHSAQAQYFSQYGRYATSLTELGPPQSGNAGPNAADLIHEDLASGTKGGYKFAMAATPTGYTINAQPVSFNSTGSKTYYSDQSMSVRQNNGQEPAGPTSPEVGGTAK
jgi:type IV pilus assembly protein PilA